jgi:hypothetical protein
MEPPPTLKRGGTGVSTGNRALSLLAIEGPVTTRPPRMGGPTIAVDPGGSGVLGWADATAGSASRATTATRGRVMVLLSEEGHTIVA